MCFQEVATLVIVAVIAGVATGITTGIVYPLILRKIRIGQRRRTICRALYLEIESHLYLEDIDPEKSPSIFLALFSRDTYNTFLKELTDDLPVTLANDILVYYARATEGWEMQNKIVANMSEVWKLSLGSKQAPDVAKRYVEHISKQIQGYWQPMQTEFVMAIGLKKRLLSQLSEYLPEEIRKKGLVFPSKYKEFIEETKKLAEEQERKRQKFNQDTLTQTE